MSILGELDELKQQRDAAVEQMADMSRLVEGTREELAERVAAVVKQLEAAHHALKLMSDAIAEAPQAQTHLVRIDDKDVEISDRDALALLAAYVLALGREKDIVVELACGERWTAQIGDIESVARQILRGRDPC